MVDMYFFVYLFSLFDAIHYTPTYAAMASLHRSANCVLETKKVFSNTTNMLYIEESK